LAPVTLTPPFATQPLVALSNQKKGGSGVVMVGCPGTIRVIVVIVFDPHRVF
jgi:hypothetical protein